ncbi:hypothetical protein BCR32DRAFT_163318 [Anaeromyces robustus]|uniref:Uncharacterized protein n=1 Tax=Anaeromyces robustus TaxID=1754192 RepID=A0A1Y1X9T6_9FUNG|nr:hypothetical protein BCR32DRAFT_163318 [Anaeromyces robustus]|eukprot:ORX82498.1 hypothetical protein BCR32DRAFT_163318 [Anaeromyces robustus]
MDEVLSNKDNTKSLGDIQINSDHNLSTSNLNKDNNNNHKENNKSPIHNELASIINENNNIGREIFKMNEENKKLIKLLQAFTTSSNISTEKKRNLEAYISSQAALLNDAKRIFVEEYNKMKNMESEISTLKYNNSYIKKKLMECRENEFRMKLQSSNDKYLLHTLASSVNIKRNLNTTAHQNVQKHSSTGNLLGNSKPVRRPNFDNYGKDAKIAPKWKHHEDTCNQQ